MAAFPERAQTCRSRDGLRRRGRPHVKLKAAVLPDDMHRRRKSAARIGKIAPRFPYSPFFSSSVAGLSASSSSSEVTTVAVSGGFGSIGGSRADGRLRNWVVEP